jgi:FKBP-type peptidyl-prolyl cis-trans isomerase 2
MNDRAASPDDAHGRAMTVHLVIWLEDGTEVLSTLDAEPLRFHPGDGTLAPGLEGLLNGLPVGTDTQLLADGSAVFGDHDPSLIQELPATDLPSGFSAEVGQVISFDTPGGQETAGTVLEVRRDAVRIDFNHPLCRRGLRVRVQVLATD